MELTEDQKKAVSQWISDGEDIAGVQRRIDDEFGISMTYMDTRFLIDDLGVALEDKVTAPIKEPVAPPPMPGAGAPAEGAMPLEPEVAPGKGAVSMEVDTITRPGTVVSGSVTFSDGVTAAWELDATGRLAVRAPQEGYQPPQDDIQSFQQQLSAELRKKGLG